MKTVSYGPEEKAGRDSGDAHGVAQLDEARHAVGQIGGQHACFPGWRGNTSLAKSPVPHTGREPLIPPNGSACHRQILLLAVQPVLNDTPDVILLGATAEKHIAHELGKASGDVRRNSGHNRRANRHGFSGQRPEAIEVQNARCRFGFWCCAGAQMPCEISCSRHEHKT